MWTAKVVGKSFDKGQVSFDVEYTNSIDDSKFVEANLLNGENISQELNDRVYFRLQRLQKFSDKIGDVSIGNFTPVEPVKDEP